jgi:hypothetical protein
MQDLTAKRTLVKSQPELWEELSEVERLAKHLGAFGEIKITKLEPEHTVAWEGKHASGTVSIEPSGWGTKVTLTAELVENRDPPDKGESGPGEEAAADAADVAADAIEAADEVPAGGASASEAPATAAIGTVPQSRRRGFWSRLFAGWLVPGERLNRATFEGTDEPGDAVEPAAGIVAVETQALEVAQDGREVSAPRDDTDARAAIDQDGARSVLEEILDALGSAHHRPFSRG